MHGVLTHKPGPRKGTKPTTRHTHAQHALWTQALWTHAARQTQEIDSSAAGSSRHSAHSATTPQPASSAIPRGLVRAPPQSTTKPPEWMITDWAVHSQGGRRATTRVCGAAAAAAGCCCRCCAAHGRQLLQQQPSETKHKHEKENIIQTLGFVMLYRAHSAAHSKTKQIDKHTLSIVDHHRPPAASCCSSWYSQRHDAPLRPPVVLTGGKLTPNLPPACTHTATHPLGLGHMHAGRGRNTQLYQAHCARLAGTRTGWRCRSAC